MLNKIMHPLIVYSVLCIGALLWALLAFGGISDIKAIKAQAIQRGYAIHCPDTGDFAWKGECDE